MGCRHSNPRQRERRVSVAPQQIESYNPDDLRERWLEYRAAIAHTSLRNRLGSFSGFRRAISENAHGSDLLFDQFRDFVNKYFDTNEDFKKRLFEAFDFEETSRITFQEAAICVNILQETTPVEKLRFIFRVFDENKDGLLSLAELQVLVDQVTYTAISLGYTSASLCASMTQVLKDLDKNTDGKIGLDEWLEGCQASVPIMTFLGLAPRVRSDREGSHEFRLHNFRSATFCNYCKEPVSGGLTGRRGLVCNLCGLVAHQACFDGRSGGCRPTSVETPDQPPAHFWVDGNVSGKCIVCARSTQSRAIADCSSCAWCGVVIHPGCKDLLLHKECSLGVLRDCIVPPCGFIVSGGRRSRRDSLNPGEEEKLAGVIQPLPGTHPVVVFINSRSGAGQGLRVIRALRRLLNPRQVYDLANGGPTEGLLAFKDVPSYRVVCCGGDGTAGWVLACLDKLALGTPRPPVSVIPLGTGNDLARCLGWGGGYQGEDLAKILQAVQHAETVMLDRWQLAFQTIDPAAETDPVPLTIINNYFSVGVDAAIALRFHHERESNPHKFSSRAKNKVYYAQYGAAEAFRSTCANLEQNLTLLVDGKEVPLPVIQGLIFVNISSMYGGSNLWGTRVPGNLRPQAIGDGLIEVVAVFGSAHVGQIKGGLRGSAHRVAQGSAIQLTTKARLPMQVDGEPWSQSACIIDIKLLNQQPMLQKTRHSSTSIDRRYSHNTPVSAAGAAQPPPSSSAPSNPLVSVPEEGDQASSGPMLRRRATAF